MPKSTYQEFRPGKWVKLVDGQVVGPATADEVAAWTRERATPARIWEDVVRGARPPPQKADQGKPQPPARESHQDSLWKDIVKQTKTQTKAEGPLKRRIAKEDTDQAEQARIWQDVLKQTKRRGPQPDRAPGGEAAPPRADGAAPPRERSPSRKVYTPEAAAAKLAAVRSLAKRVPVEASGQARPFGKSTPAKPSSRKAQPKPKPEKAIRRAATPEPVARADNESLAPPAPTRSKGKARATPAPEPAAPLYLWMVAGQTDDVLATVRTGLTRYVERFERQPEVLLCHSEDLPALEGAKLAVDLREGKSLPRRNFWIGMK
jgi:hypothetical protein